MGSSTFHQPFEDMLNEFASLSSFEYYRSGDQKFSKNRSRICHFSINGESSDNRDSILMIFKIGLNNERTVIACEGPNTPNKSSTYPKKIEAVALAKKLNWKYFAIGVPGTEVEDEIIHNYVVSIESTEYGRATAYDLADHINYLRANNQPDFYRCTGTVSEGANQVAYTFSFVKKAKFLDYVRMYDNRPFDSTPQQETVALGEPQNLIVYGTPGCGKSYYVDKVYSEQNGYQVLRTTFHPEYTYTDFIGQVMPLADADDDTVIHYEFIPGTFTKALEAAFNYNGKVALIIEEINRGNAAAIFGDIFQLLDRKSSYHIHNEQLERYLLKKGVAVENHRIMLPSNLDIIATMNTGDQNVFTLDTAFKRRWQFKMMENDFKHCPVFDETGAMSEGAHPYATARIPRMPHVTWDVFVDTINREILKTGFQSEDKQIGMYFFEKSALLPSAEEDDLEDEKILKRKSYDFAYKLFEYLWNDVAKLERPRWFGNVTTLSELIKKYTNSSNSHTVFAIRELSDAFTPPTPDSQG